jgi:hypothetical protein
MGWRKVADNEHSRVEGMSAPRCTALGTHDRIAPVYWGQTNMEFTALFLATLVVMLAAWRGSRSLALGLFAAVLIASVATYLHHATDALKLSF